MKVNFKHYGIEAAVLWIAALTLILSSCDSELSQTLMPEGKQGITFSLGVEQDEVSAALTRTAGAEKDKIKQMKYIIKKKIAADNYEVISTSQGVISADFNNLTIEGLKEGDYAIIFYATTQSDKEIPQPANDGTLTNPHNNKPLDVDYLFARVNFTVDGLKGAQTIPVTLKRCVGQIKIEIQGTFYEKRLIKGIEISLFNNDDIYTTHLDADGSYATNSYNTIKDLKLNPDKAYFYSFPSKATLTGVIKISSVPLDGTTPSLTKTYTFNDLKIEEGKISKIQLNWITPDGNGVVYTALEDITPANSYEMFQKGEPESKILVRTFDTDKPFQVELDANKKLHTAFYGPINLHDVKIMCRMQQYSEEFFQIAYYEEYPAFYETWLELPVIKQKTTFRTESGKSLTIPAQPGLRAEDCEFKVVNNDEYMRNINKITYPIKIIFDYKRHSGIHGKFTTPVSPRYGRLACILAVNLSAFFGTKEFEEGVKNYKEIPFIRDTTDWSITVPPEEIIRLARSTKRMRLTELHWVDDPKLSSVVGSATKEGQYPAVLGFKIFILEQMFPDDIQDKYRGNFVTIFHEWGHLMGFSHQSTFCSYVEERYAWQNCCFPVINKLAKERRLPVNRKNDVWDVIMAAK